MFWGLIMEPNKRYTQVVEKPFHISQAAMDTSMGDGEPAQVMVVVDGKNFLICTLQKNKNIQVPLDLYFKTGDSISFLTNGKSNVHLTGYLDPEFEDRLSSDDDEENEEDDEEEEDVPVLVPAKNKRKLEAPNNVSASKKVKPDKKAAKKAAAAESSDEDEDDDGNALRKILDGEDMDTDENDESFKINTTTEGSSSDEEEDESEEEEEEEEDDDEKGDTTLDTSTTSKDEEKVDMSKLSKSQKRRLKKKLQQQAKQQQPQVNGIDKTKKNKEENQQEKKLDKKKPEAKKEAQDGQATEKKKKETLSGGVMIEDTKVGNGPVAKPGKVVMVYYEGRLKQNNKVFDSCTKGPGFKFRLGSKEVIQGWDIGISGMKVGGKRKIVCPPAMAYGAKGSQPAVPPNSTLVFEVELKNIK